VAARLPNHLYNTARADGLTLFRISSSIVPYAVLGGPGVQYDVDKLIYLGTTEHMLYYLFNTRKEAGLDTLAKLRAATGCASAALPLVTPATFTAAWLPTCSI
jgi:hypothetical protein